MNLNRPATTEAEARPDVRVCAWCWRENRLTLLDGRYGVDQALHAIEEGEATHGVCLTHLAGLRAQARALAPIGA